MVVSCSGNQVVVIVKVMLMTMAVDKHNGGVDYSVHVVVLLAVVTSKDDESDVGKKFKKVSNLF